MISWAEFEAEAPEFAAARRGGQPDTQAGRRRWVPAQLGAPTQ